MRTKRNLAVIVAAALLAGCATSANYEKMLNSWVGVNADNLAEVWGPPQNSYALSNGGKILEYDRRQAVQMGGFTYTTPVTTFNSGNINVTGGNGMATGTYNGYSTTYVERQTPIQTFQMTCDTRFTVNESNIITRWSYQGNACRSR
jgi:hypothetical protein